MQPLQHSVLAQAGSRLARHRDEWDGFAAGPNVAVPLQHIVLDVQTQYCFPLCADYVLCAQPEHQGLRNVVLL